METTSEAFEAMFRAHYDDLHRFALRRVGPDAAADVVAEVFLIAWRRRVEIPSDAVRLWLFGVASNRILKEYRGQARRARLAARAAAERTTDLVPDPAEHLDAAATVRSTLATLPEGDQEVLRLTQWEHLTPAEAAVVVGCSPAAFRVRLHRARRRFAEALAGAGSPQSETTQDVIA